MRKLIRNTILCLIIAGGFWCFQLLKDRQTITDGLIRFHVVANSDREEDQNVKLLVRDAVLDSIRSDLAAVGNVAAAKDYLRENLGKIETIANHVLSASGFEETAVATLCREAFDAREYQTFKLPSGVYESLRIVIGEGEGSNWWCVSFPELCTGAATVDFQAAAVGSGFSDRLAGTLVGEAGYEVRFFLLDQLGKLENRFFAG